MYSAAHLLLVLLLPLTFATPVPSQRPTALNLPPAAKFAQSQAPLSPSTVEILKPKSNQFLKYTLDSVIAPTGSHSKTWSLSGDKTFIAKQFRTHDSDEAVALQQRQAFGLESMYSTRFLGEDLVTGGESKIGGAGDTFAFLVTPSLNGRDFLTQAQGFLKDPRTSRPDCAKFLRETVRPAFIKYVNDFQKDNNLVHLDPTQSNTIWSPGASKVLGFLNFEKIDKVDSPLYEEAVKKLWGASTINKVPLEQLARGWADRIYPNSLCPKSSTTRSDAEQLQRTARERSNRRVSGKGTSSRGSSRVTHA